MLKKILSVLALLVFFIIPAHAELKVDIIAGATELTSIAVLKFEVEDGARTKDAALIREVVEADLKRTGLFRIVSHDALPEYVKMGDMPDFKLWQAIKTKVLVQAKLSAMPNNDYKLEFFVWDIDGTEQIEAQFIFLKSKY